MKFRNVLSLIVTALLLLIGGKWLYDYVDPFDEYRKIEINTRKEKL